MAKVRKQVVLIGLASRLTGAEVEDFVAKVKKVLGENVGVMVVEGCTSIATIETLVDAPSEISE